MPKDQAIPSHFDAFMTRVCGADYAQQTFSQCAAKVAARAEELGWSLDNLGVGGWFLSRWRTLGRIVPLEERLRCGYLGDVVHCLVNVEQGREITYTENFHA